MEKGLNRMNHLLLFTLFFIASETGVCDKCVDKDDTQNNINSMDIEESFEQIVTEESITATETKDELNISNNITGKDDETTFKDHTSEPVKLLIGQIDEITVLDTSIRQRLPRVLEEEYVSFDSIDYIYDERVIFYSANNSIIRATLDAKLGPSNPEPIVTNTKGSMVRLAVDWVNKKLYWLEENSQTIMIADLEAKTSRFLVKDATILNFTFPNNIVVDPFEGIVFFVSNHAVYKTPLSGGDAEWIAIDGNIPGQAGRGVRTIAVDRVNKMLYVSGEEFDGSDNTHYLARVTYDGAEIEEFKMRGLHDIYSMDVIGNTIYFAHYQEMATGSELLSISTNISDDSSPTQLFRPRKYYQDICSVKIYHPCAQKLNCTSMH